MESLQSDLQKSLDEYDTSVEDVLDSNYNDYISNLNRFISLINEDPNFYQILKTELPDVDFDTWYQSGISPASMVGSGKLDWPNDRKKLISLQKRLFESFLNNDETPEGFYSKFMGGIDSLNDCVYEINQQYFRPFSRDLKKIVLSKYKQHTPIKSQPTESRKINLLIKFWNCTLRNIGKILIGVITTVLATLIIKHFI